MTEPVKNNQHLVNGIKLMISEVRCPKKEHPQRYIDTDCLGCAFASKDFPKRTCAAFTINEITRKLV
jgi:hypothetical protein